MRILPLGGAEEIGASSTVIELNGRRILVDVGIRMGSQAGDHLPDLARLQEETGTIDAIFLTHAHMDHSGALPLLHLAFPEVPIYMTPATYSILRILFSDSLRLMKNRYKEDGEIPLYPLAAVESCFGCVRPISFDYTFRVPGQNISATFHPAGHILGASTITFDSSQGSIMLSGDISVSEQRTIPGMHVRGVRPDVVMIESTYGDRLHAHRPTQEAQLVRTVAETIASGGKVLIPAFAVGRAQEVILILRQAILEKKLPEIPIYVDGMVQSVCDSYSNFPGYLQQYLRKSIRDGIHPFFPEGGSVQRVRSALQRRKVLEGGRCCIVASSGMMTGGPSAYYAKFLVRERKNLIAITGYQDEEAPGRHLLELAEKPEGKRTILLDGKLLRVSCQVKKYALSAHADSGEISGFLEQINPTQGVILVHGGDSARESLASTLEGLIQSRIYLPDNGENIQFMPGRRIFHPPRKQTLLPRIGSSEQLLGADSLFSLHRSLWAESGTKGLYRVVDLYARWYGPEQEFTPEELHDLEMLLADAPELFRRDQRRPHLFRLRSLKKAREEISESDSIRMGRMELNLALQKVIEIFPESTGLYKKGARQEEYTILLSFSFPQVAKKRYKSELEELALDTGWEVQVNDMPHHAALEGLVRRLLPKGWDLQKNPAILHEKRIVRLRLLTPQGQGEEGEQVVQGTLLIYEHEFLKQTGYQLECSFEVDKSTVSLAAQKTSMLEGEKLEINRAYQKVDEFFQDFKNKPYKKSKKGESIVLSFLSPAVGHRYSEDLKHLEKAIGWILVINPEPNQYGIKQEVRSLIPENWKLCRDPAVFKRTASVRVRLLKNPTSEELHLITEQIYERTGYTLELFGH